MSRNWVILIIGLTFIVFGMPIVVAAFVNKAEGERELERERLRFEHAVPACSCPPAAP